ncbi:PAS domain-containing protein [Rhizobium grahamii]|uniref:histidine kinase n=1 Tax=Rhizobium grahamii CCGE 502 TaxID=990285 RepID=S3IAP9_9HYPH|nr:PAS domain-containing protein [Rhizobium grahamii]EPE96348.1 multi-sensor signal transduction histidine kinase [Rhizobium grahamii CCGE 502]
MEADFRKLFDILPGLVWATGADGVINFVNRRWREYTGITVNELLERGWTATIHTSDIEWVRGIWCAAVTEGSPAEFEMRLRRHDGVYRRFSVKAEPFHDNDGRISGWYGVNTDIERQSRAEAQLEVEKQLLELVTRGVALPEILNQLCLEVEKLSPGSLCSILFSDPDELRFRMGAGPNLPGPYNAVLDGLRIDPYFGPCSLAIKTRSKVIVTDPTNDARWLGSAWPGMMVEFGLGSCWSAPIVGSRGQVLGIFAIYKLEGVGPTDEEQELIDRFARLSGIAMERAESDAMLAASTLELRRANRFLAGAQRLSKTGSFLLDTTTGEQVWSDENYRIWELEPTASPTMEMVLAAIHPDDRDRAHSAFENAVRERKDVELVYRIVTPVGGVKYLHTVMGIVSDISEHIVYLGSSQDVTESKLAEEVQRASEAELARTNTYLTAAQRLSQTGSFTWDLERDEHNWSEVIYQVFGFDPGVKVTMDKIARTIHPEDMPHVETLLRGAAIGEKFELMFRVLRADGDMRHAHVIGHRIDQIPDRPVFMGALQDITQRKRQEADLNRARAELAHVARVTALSALTASIAHEVSQPLAGIMTNANTCLRMLAADPPNLDGARMTVQRTLRDGDRASEVIKRLRGLFTRKPPSLEHIDLNEAVREVLALSSSELQRRRVIVRTELPGEVPSVLADRVQIQQVILNLVLNAADAMAAVNDHAREMHVSSQADDGGEISLFVRDAGVGLQAKNVEQLFQAFHTTKADGMGIGLSISRSIIEAHGGRLWGVSNSEGPGATFAFSIPRDVPARRSHA